MPIRDNRKKIKKEDVKNLVFSGGGAWGNVYVGAIKALEELNIIEQVNGYCGSSAGSITALLLSAGYPSKIIKKFISQKGMESLNYLLMGEEIPEFAKQNYSSSEGILDSIETFINDFKIKSSIGIDLFFANALCSSIMLFCNHLMSEPSSHLIRDEFLKRSLFRKNLENELGIFKAEYFRDFLNRKIRKKMKGAVIHDENAISFAEYKTFFGKDLLITGTNLNTRKIEIFSATSTPNLPVADAVRISMAIPWFFQPVVIKDEGEDLISVGIGSQGTRRMIKWENSILDKNSILGMWLDGGVEDNMPMLVFDKETTFGLRVTSTIIPPLSTDRLSKMFFDYLLMKFLPDESHISSSWGITDRVVHLDIGDIKPCEFDLDFDSSRVNALLNKAYNTILAYFR